MSEDSCLLEARGISKAYRTQSKTVQVLSGASLKIQAGEMLGVVGASGSGKSTLLHILGGLDKPQSGEILFKGKSIFKQSNGFLDEFRNNHIGFVFQLFNLLGDFTAFENAVMPAMIGNRDMGAARKKATALLERVGLKDRMHHKPGELSGGECQRVALARSLINAPDLLLADEPTGNLDAQASDSLMNLIRELNRDFGQTFVIVTHSQKIAQSLDRVLQLKSGRVENVNQDLIL